MVKNPRPSVEIRVLLFFWLLLRRAVISVSFVFNFFAKKVQKITSKVLQQSEMTEQDCLFREIEITLSKDDALELTRLLDEGAPLPDFRGYYEVLFELDRGQEECRPADNTAERQFAEGDSAKEDPPENRPLANSTKLVLYFSAENVIAAIHVELLLAALDIADYDIHEKILNRRDYLEAYKEHYRPFAIGERLVIVPSWHRGTEAEREALGRGDGGGSAVGDRSGEMSDCSSGVPPVRDRFGDARLPLYLDPGLVFGTGHHPTTRLCARRLEEAVRGGMRVIDAGCGSGILGIAALLLGASLVFAFDIERASLRSAIQNGALNPGISERLAVKHGGFDLGEFAEFPADLLIGNLTENVILSWSDCIRRGRFPRLILSGFLAEQKQNVIERFADEWRLVCEREEEGWVLLDFEKR